MKTPKFLRTALVATLVLSIMFSITGGTIAWFTDTVESKNNIIKSGNLDVELYASDDGTNWTAVNDESDPLFSYGLWEPGYTTYKFVKVANVGDLAFKFQLNVKADSAVTGEYKLADVIDVYTGTEKPTRANLGTRVGTLTDLMDDADGAAYGVLKAGESKALCLTLKMQESADNNYQGLSIGNGFSLQLLATQATEESDSFDNQYDANATFSTDVWTGDVPTEQPDTVVVDETTKTITVNSAEDLLYLTELAKEQYPARSDWKVVLATDIDLANRPIDTIVINQWGHFDGNGHTISNVVMNEGQTSLFTNLEGIDTGKNTFKNLTVDGITVYAPNQQSVGGVIGYTNAALSNITVKNADITGQKYVGAISGRASTIKDSKVYNSTVTIPVDGEKTVGGMVGYLVVDGFASDVTSVSSGNEAKNVTVSGPYNVGGLFGQVQGASSPLVVKNNSISDSTVAYAEVPASSSDATADAIAARRVGNVTVENNTVTNVAMNVSYTVDSAAELKTALETAGAAAAGNNIINLTADVDLSNTAWTPIKVDGYHGADIVTVNGNGNTITGLNAPLFAGGFAGGSGIVIKDLTIADSVMTSTHSTGAGAFIEYVDSMDIISLTNCHLKNTTLNATATDPRAGGMIGYTAGYNNTNDGPVRTNITVKNCSVVECEVNCKGSVGGIIGHSGGNAWTYTTIDNCIVKDCKLNSTDDGGWRVGVVVGTVGVGEQNDISNITESGNTLTQTGKTAPAGQSNLYGRFVPNDTGKLTIDGVAIN